jgi:ParB family chromosome partitioning protein
MKISVNNIVVKDNRRELKESTVAELMQSINEVGLLNPVTIDEDNNLIAGAHRLEAIKRLGWSEIDCNVIGGLDDLQKRMAELDENIIRNNGSYLERDEWMLERKEIYEALHPETKHGMRNGQTSKNDNLSSLESFAQDVAEKTGLSERTIQRSIQRAADIIPDMKEIIKETDMPKSTATDIARLETEEQKTIAKEIEILKDNNPHIPKSEYKEMVGSIIEKNLSEREQILKRDFKDINEKYALSQSILNALVKVGDLKLLDLPYAVQCLIETGARTRIYPDKIVSDAKECMRILQDIVDLTIENKNKEEVIYEAH